jgi:exodeoxyribonuclease V alpha subunit
MDLTQEELDGMQNSLLTEPINFARLVYKNEDYQIVSYVTKETKIKFSLKGKHDFPKQPNVDYKITSGLFVIESRTNKRSGQVINDLILQNGNLVIDTDAPTAAKALLVSVPGIGSKTADRILAKFEQNTMDIIKKSYIYADAKLDECSPDVKELRLLMKDHQFKALINLVEMNSEYVELYEFLVPFGISDKVIHRMIKKYKKKTLSLIKKNPYLLSLVPSVSFKTADWIASQLGFYAGNPNRIRSAIFEVIHQSQHNGVLFQMNDSGNCFLEVRELQEKLRILLGNPNMLELQDINLGRILKEMVDDDAIKFITTKETPRRHLIFSNRMYKNEVICAKKLIKHMNEKTEIKHPEKYVRKAEKLSNITLAEKQKEGAITALTEKISIVTGGAGVGKTVLLNTIIKAYKLLHNNEVDILLLAPTGKAAQKMSDATGLEAKTIHSALHLNVGDGNNNTVANEYIEDEEVDSMIEAELLIVDEMSMVDANLFYEIIRRLDKNTTVLFVGDTGQLPSIGPGLVLKELIASGTIPTTILDVVQRQAAESLINKNANIIREMKTGIDAFGLGSDFDFKVINNSEQIVKEVISLYETKVKEYGVENVIVLTPYRQKTLTCSNELNDKLRKLVNKESKFHQHGFAPGDRIMYIKNTEKLNLYNGDLGYVISVPSAFDSEKVITVAFDKDGEDIELKEDDMSNIVLAYSMSIHKSQCSEYKAFILVVDKLHKSMHNMNLLYTAITRASEELILVGDDQTFFEGAKRPSFLKRNTDLARQLKRFSELEEIAIN